MRVSKLRAGITLVACLCAYAGFTPAMAEDVQMVRIAVHDASGALLPNASVADISQGTKEKVPNLGEGTWYIKGPASNLVLLVGHSRYGSGKAAVALPAEREVHVIVTLGGTHPVATVVSGKIWPHGDTSASTAASADTVQPVSPTAPTSSAERPVVQYNEPTLSAEDFPSTPRHYYAPTFQGGDTCGEAVVIGPGLPISVSGTTVGYTDDYDEVCPYTGSTAPDVVYAYTPSANEVVTMTLCLGMTDYDTKMYVYENTCPDPGNFYACNDDACTSAAGQSYVSELASLSVTGGNTYYIVIDGYSGGDSGNYFLDITEAEGPPECPATTLNNPPTGQPVHLPGDMWTAGVSDEDFPFIRFENFSDVSGEIADIHWWGIEVDAGLYNCTRTPNNFEIIFYADAGGVPGAVVCSYIVTPTRVDTGLVYHSTYQLLLYEYSAILSPGCTLTDGWVSVQGIDAVGCRFWMMTGSGGDSYSCGDDGTGVVCGLPDFDYDPSLCLTGEYVDYWGACCDDEADVCEDCILSSECLPPLRFASETLCVDMEVPCGHGACCDLLTGLCTITADEDCAGADQLFMGYATDCDPNPCPCVVPCPPGGVDEAEPCGDDTNGGCNSTPPVFEPIACDETKCGTAWFDGSTRDTDWYELVTTESMIFSISAEAEFDILAGMIEQIVPGVPGCANITGYIASPYILAGECEPTTVVMPCQPAGTYYFFGGPQFTSVFTCPADYVLTVECEPCYIPVGACCIQNGDCIPDQTENQCLGMSGQWQGDGTSCVPNPCIPWYCESGATSTYDSICEGVHVNTIVNDTPGVCATYSDFTAMSTDLMRGATYPIDVIVGTCGGCYSKYAKMFIDWNQDIDLVDAGEQAWTSGASSSTCPQTFSGTITVPVGAALGNTRMRVVVREGGSEATTLPCGTYTWGETEDYTVNIVVAPPIGACCEGMICHPDMTEADCTAAGWVYKGDGSTCTPVNPCIGACCFADGSCTEVPDAGTCTGLGGTYQGDGTVCVPNPCPQPGDNCGNPIVLDGRGLPLTDTNTTCGRGDDYSDTCLGYYDGGEDIMYQVLLNAGYIKITVDPKGTTYAGFAMDDVCPPDSDCILMATNSSASTPFSSQCTYVDAGTYYVMVDTWPSPNCIPDFDLTIEACEPCIVDCVDNEGEGDCYDDYDDTYNAGCNAVPPVFQSINCGDTICGSSGVFAFGTSTYRDMDWFEFDIAVDSYITWAVSEAEFPVALWILDPGTGLCDGSEVVLAFGNEFEVCEPLSITTDCVGAGTYWLIIATADWGDYDCGVKYEAMLTCESCEIPTGACCFDDGSCVPDMYEADCIAAGGILWYEGVSCSPNPCPQPVDCSNPMVIAAVPFSDVGQTTCVRGNNYEDTCMGYYDGGEDMMYELTLDDGTYLMVTLDPKGTTWSGFAVDDSCPPDDTCIAVVTSSGGGLKVSDCLALAAGTYYIMVDTWPSPDCIPDYDLTIVTCTPPIGACCYNDGADCVDTDPLDCTDTYGGDWYAGEECATFDCPTPCPEDTITIEITTDSWGDETSADLIEQGTATVMWSVAEDTLADNTFYTWDVCVLTAGCYDLSIYDSYGDGGPDWDSYLNGSWHAGGSLSGSGGLVDTLGGGCTPLTGDPQGDWDDDDVDTVPNVCDNCPLDYNPGQDNSDNDSHGDACDNCPTVDNENQLNSDNDSHGDACDNCPTVDNENQANSDGDTHGNACDNCPNVDNENQLNSDNDSHGDACDNCPMVDNDNQANGDGDSYGDACDNCPEDWNEDQADRDQDGVGDVCDNCPDDANPLQTNSDVTADPPGDTLGDMCDNCPVHANEDQADLDGDSEGPYCQYDTGLKHGGDVCDVCPSDPCHRDMDKNGIMDCAQAGFIPTVSAWGLLVLALLLLTGAKVYFRRRTA